MFKILFIILPILFGSLHKSYAQKYDLHFAIDSLVELGEIEGITDRKQYAELITEVATNILISHEHQFEYNIYKNYKSRIKKETPILIKFRLLDRINHDSVFNDNSYSRLQKQLRYRFDFQIIDKRTKRRLNFLGYFYEQPLPNDKIQLRKILEKALRIEVGICGALFPPTRKINIQNKTQYQKTVAIDSAFIATNTTGQALASKLTQMIENNLLYNQAKIKFNYYPNYQQAKKTAAQLNLTGRVEYKAEEEKYYLQLIWRNEKKEFLHDQIIAIDKLAAESADLTLLTFQVSKFNTLIIGHKGK